MVARPLALQLHDPDVQHAFLHSLDVSVLSADGSVALRVMRGRDTGARVFLCVDGTAKKERLDSVLLDKTQAAFLRNNIAIHLLSLKKDHDIILRGVAFKAREAQRVVEALTRFVEKG